MKLGGLALDRLLQSKNSLTLTFQLDMVVGSRLESWALTMGRNRSGSLRRPQSVGWDAQLGSVTIAQLA